MSKINNRQWQRRQSARQNDHISLKNDSRVYCRDARRTKFLYETESKAKTALKFNLENGAMNLFIVAVIVCLVLILHSTGHLALFAPSQAGLIDNLWSAIMVTLMVMFYLEVTNQGVSTNDDFAEDTAMKNYILQSYEQIKTKHSIVIKRACSKYGCPEPLLCAILIYENMNRPRLFRRLENIILKIFKKPMTVGIAQVMSNKPLSDEESIKKAANILGKVNKDNPIDFVNSWTKLEDMLTPILDQYNKGQDYRQNIQKILNVLMTYSNGVFFN